MLRDPAALNSTSHDIVAFLYEELKQERAARAELQQQLQQFKSAATADHGTSSAHALAPQTRPTAAVAPSPANAALHSPALQHYAAAAEPPPAAAAWASTSSILQHRSRRQLLHELQQAANTNYWPHADPASLHPHHRQRQHPHIAAAPAAEAPTQWHPPHQSSAAEPYSQFPQNAATSILRVPTPHQPTTAPAVAVTPLTHRACNSSSNPTPPWSAAASSSNTRCTHTSHSATSSSSRDSGGWRHGYVAAAAEAAELSPEAAAVLETAAAVRDRNSLQLLLDSVLTSSSSSDGEPEDKPDVVHNRRYFQDEHYVHGQQQLLGHQQQEQRQQPPWHNPSPVLQQQQRQQLDSQYYSKSKLFAARLSAEGIHASGIGAALPTQLLPTDKLPDQHWQQEIDTFCNRLDDFDLQSRQEGSLVGSLEGSNKPLGSNNGRLGTSLDLLCNDDVGDMLEVGPLPGHATRCTHGLEQQFETVVVGPSTVQPSAAACDTDGRDAAAATGNQNAGLGCSRCELLKEQLLECEFERELTAAQLAVVVEERDVLALETESLLNMVCSSSNK